MKELFDVGIFYSRLSRSETGYPQDVRQTLFSALDRDGHHIVSTCTVDQEFDHTSLLAPTEQLLKQRNPLAVVVTGDSLLASIVTTGRMLDTNAWDKIPILYVPIGKHSMNRRSYGTPADTEAICKTLHYGQSRRVPRADIIYTHTNGQKDYATALVAAGFRTEGGKYGQYVLHPKTHKPVRPPSQVEEYHITEKGKTLFQGRALLVEAIPGRKSANVTPQLKTDNQQMTIAVLPATSSAVQQREIAIWHVNQANIAVTPASSCHFDGQYSVDHYQIEPDHHRIFAEPHHLEQVTTMEATAGNHVIFRVAPGQT